MLYAISWFLVLALLATWSMGIWLLHGLAVWSLTGVDALASQSQQLDRFSIPAWVGLWVPDDLILAFKVSAAAVLPWLEAALSALPSLAGWLGPLAWTVWGVGLLFLALGAVALHVLSSMTRKATVP